MVEIETKCRTPIWWTFGRIQWHVIPEPHAALQGAVTWRNQCHDRATLRGVRIQSAILKIVFRHILFIYFCFLMQFGLRLAAAFVSSPIHLLLFNEGYMNVTHRVVALTLRSPAVNLVDVG